MIGKLLPVGGDELGAVLGQLGGVNLVSRGVEPDAVVDTEMKTLREIMKVRQSSPDTGHQGLLTGLHQLLEAELAGGDLR